MWLHEVLSGQLHGQGHHGLGEEYKDRNGPGEDARAQSSDRHNVSEFSRAFDCIIAAVDEF